MTTPTTEERFLKLEAEVSELLGLVGDLPAVKAKRKYLADQAAITERGLIAAMPTDQRNEVLLSMSPEAVAAFFRSIGNRVDVVNSAPDEDTRAEWYQHLDRYERGRADLACVVEDDLPRPVYLVAAMPREFNGGMRTWSGRYSPKAIDVATASRAREVGLVARRVDERTHELTIPNWTGPGDRVVLPCMEAVEVLREVHAGVREALADGDLLVVEASIGERRAAWLRGRV